MLFLLFAVPLAVFSFPVRMLLAMRLPLPFVIIRAVVLDGFWRVSIIEQPETIESSTSSINMPALSQFKNEQPVMLKRLQRSKIRPAGWFHTSVICWPLNTQSLQSTNFKPRFGGVPSSILRV